MMRTLVNLMLAVGIVLGNMSAPAGVIAQEKGGAEKAERSKDKKKDGESGKSGRSADKGKKKDEPKGAGVRLPRFFASLVDEAQREKILSIRAKHQPKIEDLRLQLAALEKQEMDEIESVLTPAQLKQLDALKANAGKGDAPKEKGKPKE